MASRWPQRFPLAAVHQPLDLGLGQVLAGAQVGVGEPLGRNCSFYGGWRDQLEVRFGHVFRPPRATDCSYNGPFTNSWQVQIDPIRTTDLIRVRSLHCLYASKSAQSKTKDRQAWSVKMTNSVTMLPDPTPAARRNGFPSAAQAARNDNWAPFRKSR